MRPRSIRSYLVAAVLALAPAAGMAGVNYNWVQVGYAVTDYGFSEDLEGVDLRASAWLHRHVFVEGLYRHQDARIGHSRSETHAEYGAIALGFRYGVTREADIYAAPALEYADRQGVSSEYELGARIGFRQRLNRLEVGLEARSLFTGDEGDTLLDDASGTTVNALFHVSRDAALFVEYDNTDYGARDTMETLTVGGRANF